MREMPGFEAGTRALQCVASAGLVFRVVSRIRCSSSGVSTRRDRFRFCGSQIPAVPGLANAARAANTVGRDKPVCRAIKLFDQPLTCQEDNLTPAGGSLRCGPCPKQFFQLTLLFLADPQCRSTSKHTIIESRVARIVNN